ncbi:FAD:protein FMN transferase [Shimia sp.]|uniref:FAD:protein FMN transferase n=1 Tax=Shimia sp. TaxID=1954381 RepID=UPI003298A076
MTLMNRRRFLTIAAACAAVPAGAMSVETATWRGQAMGAGTVMKLAGMSQSQAVPIFEMVEAELRRLEAIFSLYRESELVRVNRDGRLTAPSSELLEVLSLVDGLHRASGGVFDPTVQPMWLAHAEQRDVRAVRAAVGWDRVGFDAAQVVLDGDGMALTLNGVAQGYVTDKITALLRAQGLRDVLMDMGEVAALGQRADGAAWDVGIADPDGRVLQRLQMRDRALATSAVRGTVLGGRAHILHPDGKAAEQALVSVSAPRAVVADGLSTALCLMSKTDGAAMVAQYSGARVEAML